MSAKVNYLRRWKAPRENSQAMQIEFQIFSLLYRFAAFFTNDLAAHEEFATCLPHKHHFQPSNGSILNREPVQLADHVQFLITEIGPATPKTPKTPSSAKTAKDFEREQPDDFELVAAQPLVSPQIFCQVFPFHIMFNRQMKIVQAGKSVSRVIPKMAEENCPLLDMLEPVRPHIQLSFQTILAHISTIYVLKTKPGTMLEPEMFMRLKVNGTLIKAK